MNQTAHFYPIGTPGQAWGVPERAAWLAKQVKQRSYAADVLNAIPALEAHFERQNYGEIAYQGETFPLLALKSRAWQHDLPCALITGGVHGYETSGVHGALQFAAQQAANYTGKINLVMVPCVSPWAYERVQRWNALAIDPNRSFRAQSDQPLAEESQALMRYLATFANGWTLHVDLHETTDTDESEFRPALSSRDGKSYQPGTIPDGFYTVGDRENPQLDFQNAIIDAVSKVTHIAEADAHGHLIGDQAVAFGVILYPLKSLGLCASVTSARFTTTTEVYPDSKRATPDQCNAAQVAAVVAALDYALVKG